jgi:hypothetical protein
MACSADRWSEPTEQFIVAGSFHQTGPEAVSEEVKFNVRILSLSLPVLAVDDLGLRRMHLKAAVRRRNAIYYEACL